MSNDNVIPLRPHQLAVKKQLEDMTINTKLLLDGAPGFMQGQFISTLFRATGGHVKMSKGLIDLFAGKEDLVLGPEDHHQLFGYKSMLTWNLVMKDEVLRERYLNAKHIVYDIEAPSFDFDKMKKVHDECKYFVIDSCPEDFYSDVVKKPKYKRESSATMSLPEKTKMSSILSSIYPESKQDE